MKPCAIFNRVLWGEDNYVELLSTKHANNFEQSTFFAEEPFEVVFYFLYHGEPLS